MKLMRQKLILKYFKNFVSQISGTVSFRTDVLTCGGHEHFWELSHVLATEHLQWNKDAKVLWGLSIWSKRNGQFPYIQI